MVPNLKRACFIFMSKYFLAPLPTRATGSHFAWRSTQCPRKTASKGSPGSTAVAAGTLWWRHAMDEAYVLSKNDIGSSLRVKCGACATPASATLRAWWQRTRSGWPTAPTFTRRLQEVRKQRHMLLLFASWVRPSLGTFSLFKTHLTQSQWTKVNKYTLAHHSYIAFFSSSRVLGLRRVHQPPTWPLLWGGGGTLDASLRPRRLQMAPWVISLFENHCGGTRGFEPGIPACESGES